MSLPRSLGCGGTPGDTEEIELRLPGAVCSGLSALEALVAKHEFGVRLYVEPQEYVFRGDTAIAFGTIEWRSVEEDDAVVERHQDGAAAYLFRGDRIARFTPYPDAATARRSEEI